MTARKAALLRLPLCWLGWCPCRHYEDADGCGGQCSHCGKIVGYVTNAQLRRYADLTAARAVRATEGEM